MSRFPELRRIERAIKSQDARQLHWAMSYCESRLSIDTDPQQLKDWHALIDRVRTALQDAPRDG